MFDTDAPAKARLESLAEEYLRLKLLAARHDKEAKEARVQCDKVKLDLLDEANRSGIESFSIRHPDPDKKGPTFSIKPKTRAWVRVENLDQAKEWLESQGCGKIIKPDFRSLSRVISEMMEEGKQIPDFINVQGYEDISHRTNDFTIE